MLPGAQLHLYDANAQHAALLQKHLVLAGHQLTLFRTFDALTSAFSRELPEILLLVPSPDQLQDPEEIHRLREAYPALLILVLLDSAFYQDRSIWLRGGADVVLSRPYALEELQAWIISLLRRSGSSASAHGSQLVYADLSCDLSGHQVESNVHIQFPPSCALFSPMCSEGVPATPMPSVDEHVSSALSFR